MLGKRAQLKQLSLEVGSFAEGFKKSLSTVAKDASLLPKYQEISGTLDTLRSQVDGLVKEHALHSTDDKGHSSAERMDNVLKELDEVQKIRDGLGRQKNKPTK